MFAVSVGAERRVTGYELASLPAFQQRYAGDAGWVFVERHQFASDEAVAHFMNNPSEYAASVLGELSRPY